MTEKEKLQKNIQTLKDSLTSSAVSPELKGDMEKQLKNLEEKLTTLEKKEEKPSPAPAPSPEPESLDFHLSKLQEFKQETLVLKGADLKKYQTFRDNHESVMAVATAAKNSKRKTVQDAANFLQSAAAKDGTDTQELKKLLARLNTLLKVKDESKPDCKTCSAPSKKKAISTKKRQSKYKTTYEECLQILQNLPPKLQKQAMKEMGANPDDEGKKKDSKGSKPSDPNKKRTAPAKAGTKQFTAKIAADSLISVSRIVKAKVKKDPIEAHNGLCKLQKESELVKDAGGITLLREGLKKLKTYSSGIVNADFLTEFDSKLKELLNFVEQERKKAEKQQSSQ